MREESTKNTNFKFAPYAITEDKSRGRIEKEEHIPEDERNEFHHDLDRIIQSKAFQRLSAKTQVIFLHESSPSTNRRTHSLAVARIAESLAVPLGLNTFAVRAMAIGHDLGHTPFGHCGERTLNKILKDHNMPGFKHNYQSLLTVNKLEQGYKKDCGLNLMYETRDGILKHTRTVNNFNICYYDSDLSDTPGHPITLEGQVVSIADEIAQRMHDTEDGLRTNRIKIDALVKEKIIKDSMRWDKLNIANILIGLPKDKENTISKIIRALTRYYISQTLDSATQNLKKHNIKDFDDVVNQENSIIAWNEDFYKDDEMYQKKFLWPNFYRHFDIQCMDSRAVNFLTQLFKAFKKQPGRLPEPTFIKFSNAVRDYILKEAEMANGDYKEDLGRFLNHSVKRCAETCSYISNFGNNTNEHTACPLNVHKKEACEGIRIIINHIAGMTDDYAQIEFSRLS